MIGILGHVCISAFTAAEVWMDMIFGRLWVSYRSIVVHILPLFLSIYLSVCLSVCLSIYPSIHQSINLPIYLAGCQNVGSWVRSYYPIYIGARFISILWAYHTFISIKSKIKCLLCGRCSTAGSFCWLRCYQCCHCCHYHWPPLACLTCVLVPWNTHGLVGRLVG